MNFKNKLDFCVIPNPYNRGAKNLVFVCYSGTNALDDKLYLDSDYEILKTVMGQIGLAEIDCCIFETSDNVLISMDELKVKLTEIGLRYSKPFEFNIIGDLEMFHRDLISNSNIYNSPTMVNSGIIDNSAFTFSTTVPTTVQTKFKVPKVGEKITLHFYLFLQCHFVNENDCVLELVGDLQSKENNNTRNFLKITKSEFIRLDSSAPNVILLQSTKTYKDFVDEINFLHKGNFRFVRPVVSQGGDMIVKSKEFVYSIMEIRKNINPVHRIVVEANLNQYYDSMISISKKIKKELTNEHKKLISLESMRPEMLLLKQKLKDKMLSLAEMDEFEKANALKSDINFIDNKIKIVDNLEEKNITSEEYLKTFCLNS